MSTDFAKGQQEEIEAHHAAMQRMTEFERRMQRDISERIQRDIEAANQRLQEAWQEVKKSAKRAIQAAKEEADNEIQCAQVKAREQQNMCTYAIGRKKEFMQRDHERLLFLREVFNEAPDVFELIVPKLSRSDGEGGLNAFRLVDQ